MTKIKKCKYLLILISFIVALTSAVLLISFILFYNSHKVYKIKEFDFSLTHINGILVSEDKAYLYNSYGGSFFESQLFSRPLSQYGDFDKDYYYYSFNSRFVSAHYPDYLFSGANTSSKFVFKNETDLFLANTENRTITPILEGHNIISASMSGTYFLEEDDGVYYFHKRLTSDFDFSQPVPLLVSDNIKELKWINDRYLSFISESNTHFIYFIADAESGEVSPAYTALLDAPEYQRKPISERYFLKDVSKTELTLFSISLQEDIVIKYSASDTPNVVAVSHDASYIALIDAGEYKLISKDGKEIPVSELIQGECKEIIFLDNRVVLFNYNDGTNKSTAYNLLF